VILDIDSIYRFLDKLNNKLKDEVEQIVFRHTQNVLMGDISVVFYDMTTLYFEASDEDDLRAPLKTDFRTTIVTKKGLACFSQNKFY
jgi:hypothetical protein